MTTICADENAALRNFQALTHAFNAEIWGRSAQIGPARSVRKVCGIFVANSADYAGFVDSTDL